MLVVACVQLSSASDPSSIAPTANNNGRRFDSDPEFCVHQLGSTHCDPNFPGPRRTTDLLTNDGRQLFIKISYLFRR